MARLIAKGCNLDPDAVSPRSRKKGHSIPEWMFFTAAAELILAEAAGGADALAEIRRERDEADRAAGAALRQVAHLNEAAAQRASWLSKAKQQEGADQNTSFDDVWAALRAERDALRADLAAATGNDNEAIGAWREDKARLDWLDGVNTSANRRNGTVYGWHFDINHNRAALMDSHHHRLTVREAIDCARFPDRATTIRLNRSRR